MSYGIGIVETTGSAIEPIYGADVKSRLQMVSETAQKDMFAVDIDSTLYSFEDVAREVYLDLYEKTDDREYLKGAYHSWDEWRSPADVCGIDIWMDVINRCHQPHMILKQKPFKGAVDTLLKLAVEGYPILYISTRDGEAAEATDKWLRNRGFPMQGFNTKLVCTMEDKGKYLSECRYLIDDRPKTLIDFIYDPAWDQASKGKRKGLSLMYPYNRALTDIPDLFLSPTWAGISSWLIRKGILSV